MDGQNKSFLVVEGMITDQNEPQQIKLTRTVSYLNPVAPIKVDDAIVAVECDGVTVAFKQTSPGVYTAPDGYIGVVGKTYHLSINLDGKVYSATSTMRAPLVIDAVSTRKSKFDKDKFDIRGAFTENPEKGDNVLMKYAINGTMIDSVKEWSYFNDNTANGERFDDVTLFGAVTCKVNDQVTIYSYSISKEYYDFINAASNSLQEPLPFFPPPGSSISGNITNGGLGFFQASAVRKKSGVVAE